MSGAASNIVATLKSKIKETADELEKYEGVCEETRVRCQHTDSNSANSCYSVHLARH